MNTQIKKFYDCYNEEMNKTCSHNHDEIDDIIRCLALHGRITKGYKPRIIFKKQIQFQLSKEIDSFILAKDFPINLKNCLNYYYIWYREEIINGKWGGDIEKYKLLPENIEFVFN